MGNNINPKEPFQICPYYRKNYLNDIAIDLTKNMLLLLRLVIQIIQTDAFGLKL